MLCEILGFVNECILNQGGEILSMISDNHKTNKKTYEILRERGGFENKKMMHDPVHLMKSIRKNWITEKSNKLSGE